jgi:hypothetical protein
MFANVIAHMKAGGFTEVCHPAAAGPGIFRGTGANSPFLSAGIFLRFLYIQTMVV